MTVQDTSLEAYEAIKPFTPDLRLRVYNEVLRRADGATCEQIETSLELSHQSASARINELVYDGLLVKGEKKGVNKTGKSAILWQAVHPKDAIPLTKPEKPIRVAALALYGAAQAALKALNTDDPIVQMEARDQLSSAIATADKALNPKKGSQD